MEDSTQDELTYGRPTMLVGRPEKVAEQPNSWFGHC